MAYSKATSIWLNKLGADSSFSIGHIQNTNKIDKKCQAGISFLKTQFTGLHSNSN